MTFFMSLKPTLGAASRSSASLAWNSSRNSSGTRPTSRNDMTWPSFIAAPFIVPRAATISSAVSRWRGARPARALARAGGRGDRRGGLELALGERALLALVAARDVRRARAHLL